MEGLYLLRFDPPYSVETKAGWTKTAGYYLGFSTDIRARVHQHAAGGAKASPLVRAALGAGSRVWLVNVWPGGDRTLERKLKNQRHLRRHDPTPGAHTPKARA